MNDEAIERQLWEAFARCVPDEELRRTIAARVIGREAAADPRVVVAREVLAAATPEQIDAAFARAVDRGSFSPADEAEVARQPLLERLASAVLDAASDLAAKLDRLSEVFVMPLTLARGGGVLGAGEAEHAGDDDVGAFRFDVPSGLVAFGLAARGSAELADGILEVRVRRISADALPPIVVIAVADGKATEPVVMTQERTAVSALLVWDDEGIPGDVLLGVVAQP